MTDKVELTEEAMLARGGQRCKECGKVSLLYTRLDNVVYCVMCVAKALL